MMKLADKLADGGGRETGGRPQRKHGEVTVTWNERRGAWYYRAMIDGRRYEKSTGVTSKAAAGKAQALKKAKEIAEALREGSLARIGAVVKRAGFAKCGEVVDIFLKHGPERSREAAGKAFGRFVRDMSGRSDWREASTAEVLTGPMLRLWAERQRQAGRSEYGIHSAVQAIKSVVARRRMHLFAKLQLPDLEAFQQVSEGSTKISGYQPIPRDRLLAMDAAARVPLRRRDPKVWAAYWLMRKAGLRNDEVQNLKWEWIDWHKDGTAELVLVRRADWQPKSTEGRVPVRGRMLRLMQAVFGCKAGFVIPRANKTEAEDITERRVNDFVRPFLYAAGKDSRTAKVAYQLRKEFGSTIAQRDGIETAARLLRNSLEVCFKHYHNLVKRPKPL